MYGSKPLGVPEPKGKAPTICEEFNLSYKKVKPLQNEITPKHFCNNFSSNKKRVYSANFGKSNKTKKGATDNKM